MKEKLILNIGAGHTYIENAVNIDISSRADISLDLNSEALPFETDSVSEIFSYHTIEHLDNYIFALSEIYRVLSHGGIFLLGVPYLTLTQYNLVNPYHRQNFNEYSFDFFDPEKLLGSAAEEGSIVFKKIFHRFHYMPEFENKSQKRKDWCRRYLFNVVQKIDFGLIAIKESRGDININANEETLLNKFDGFLRARKLY